jgi:transposase
LFEVLGEAAVSAEPSQCPFDNPGRGRTTKPLALSERLTISTVHLPIGGVGLQIVCDKVVRFNARGPDGLLDGKAPGKRSLLNDAQRRALVEAVERGPIPAIHGVVRWQLIGLVQWLHEEFAVSLDETTVGRELKELGLCQTRGAAPPPCPKRICDEGLKKGDFAAELAKVRTAVPRGTPIEIWFQVEARVGQKNKITRRWAKRGTRPSAP